MIRGLFNLIATVSLLLAFTAIVFWIRSYQHAEAICLSNVGSPDFHQLGSLRGLVIAERIALPADLTTEYQRGLWVYSRESTIRSSLGYHADGALQPYGPIILIDGTAGLPETFGSDVIEGGLTCRGVAIPFWTVSGLLLLFPLARFASLAQSRRRQQAGLCPQCGYDLRESPERCPECGRSVQSV